MSDLMRIVTRVFILSTVVIGAGNSVSPATGVERTGTRAQEVVEDEDLCLDWTLGLAPLDFEKGRLDYLAWLVVLVLPTSTFHFLVLPLFLLLIFV